MKLCFTTYIGDGDTKAYPTVVKAEPNKQIVKGECVGHAHKRIGGRLRKFKKVRGNELVADNNKLDGVGRLNDKWINKLQNYYGLAIHQNTDSLILMRKAVGAVLYHCGEATSSEARHMFCHKLKSLVYHMQINQALNAFIWKRLSKDVFVGPYVLEMGVCSAIINFNSGTNGILKNL